MTRVNLTLVFLCIIFIIDDSKYSCELEVGDKKFLTCPTFDRTLDTPVSLLRSSRFRGEDCSRITPVTFHIFEGILYYTDYKGMLDLSCSIGSIGISDKGVEKLCAYSDFICKFFVLDLRNNRSITSRTLEILYKSSLGTAREEDSFEVTILTEGTSITNQSIRCFKQSIMPDEGLFFERLSSGEGYRVRFLKIEGNYF